jgi:hypothetical protein
MTIILAIIYPELYYAGHSFWGGSFLAVVDPEV